MAKPRKQRVGRSNGNDWIRLWRDTMDNPKIWYLSPETLRTWILLLCMTDKHGLLPDIKRIAHKLRLLQADAQQRINELVELRLVDPVGIDPKKQSYQMHDWDTWQPAKDNSTERMRKLRERNRVSDGDVTVSDGNSLSSVVTEGNTTKHFTCGAGPIARQEKKIKRGGAR